MRRESHFFSRAEGFGSLGASLPVYVSEHAIDAGSVRSSELADANRHRILEAIRAEVKEALAAGRVTPRKPVGFCRPGSGDRGPGILYALAAGGLRCYVVKVVESRDGLSWLAVTTLVADADA